MRPIYETRSTLEDEVRFFADLQGHLDYSHYQFRKLPLAYRVECVAISALSQRVEGFCELKRRHVPMRAYSTLILSLHKWDDLVRYSRYGWSRLFVRWEDCDAVVPVHEATTGYYVGFGGRDLKDRGDWQDQEPVVHIPMSAFEVLDLERTEGLPDYGGDTNSWSL